MLFLCQIEKDRLNSFSERISLMMMFSSKLFLDLSIIFSLKNKEIILFYFIIFFNYFIILLPKELSFGNSDFSTTL